MTDLIKAFKEKGELTSSEIRELSENPGKELSELVAEGKVKVECLTKNSIWKWTK